MSPAAIIYITLCVVVLFGTVILHDKPISSTKHNFWHTLIRISLLTALLCWGRFFKIIGAYTTMELAIAASEQWNKAHVHKPHKPDYYEIGTIELDAIPGNQFGDANNPWGGSDERKNRYKQID